MCGNEDVNKADKVRVGGERKISIRGDPVQESGSSELSTDLQIEL